MGGALVTTASSVFYLCFEECCAPFRLNVWAVLAIFSILWKQKPLFSYKKMAPIKDSSPEVLTFSCKFCPEFCLHGQGKRYDKKIPTLYLDDNVVCSTWIKILIESLVILSKKLRSTGFQCTDSKVCSLSWVNRMTQKCHWKRRIPWEKCKMHLGSVTLLFCVESWHAF